MSKKTSIIIGLQALLIIILFWMLVFYGKDEYENYQVAQEEEIESADRVRQEDGISIVSLPAAVQKNSGITTAKVAAFSYQNEVKSFGTVVAIDELIDAQAKRLHLNAALKTAQANKSHHQQQYARLQALNADGKNVSDLAVQQAAVALKNDEAAVQSHALQINNLKTSLTLKWGSYLANLATQQQPSPRLKQLLARKMMLVKVSLPFNVEDPKKGDEIYITPLNSNKPTKARYLAKAAGVDANGAGKTYYYSAPAQQLRTGMRVSVVASAGKTDAVAGIVIPSAAVVWYAGTPWAYFKEGDDEFVRKPISADIEIDAGWFNTGFDTDSELVIKGAQLLLSEEFKYLIKNENDD